MLDQLAMRFAGSLGQGLGSSIGGAPTSAQSGAYGTTLDGSGWIVNMGSGTQVASASPTRTMTDPAAPAPIMQAGGSTLAYLMLGGAALVFFLKRRK